jgi:hypothetical protein
MKLTLAVVFVATAALAGVEGEVDCAGQACPELKINGDAASDLPNGQPSPFRGFADPSIRRDPSTGRLWMAYSWPSVKVNGAGRMFRRPGGVEASVAIHLAFSDDNGDHWRYYGPLWDPTPERAPNGTPGHTSHEVANLLPRQVGGKTIWYAARLDYFLPDVGGFRSRPPQSFRVRVFQADTVPGLADAPSETLGSARTDPAYGVDQNLTTLSPNVRQCHLWNEPALYSKGDQLYLTLSCRVFEGRRPNSIKQTLEVFSTRPDGPPNRWRWRYAGRLSGPQEAKELGGEDLTQIELANSRDGQLLAVVSPERFSDSLFDFVRTGCVAVAVASLDPPRLARTASGALDVRARIVDSDAGPHGTAACAYDPASSTGILLVKRQKENVGFAAARGGGGGRMSVSIHRTGARP